MRPWLIPVALLLSAAYWAVANGYLRASIDEVVTDLGGLRWCLQRC